MANCSHLSGLSFTAVECATEHICAWSAYDFHRVPEVSGLGLVGDILELSNDLSVLDSMELLSGELEVITLHID